jgi:hypothetical protein
MPERELERLQRWCGLFAVFVFVVPAAPIASAGRPTIDPFNNPDQTIAGICPFTVFAHFDVDREKVITFSNGNFLITGALKVTFTLERPSRQFMQPHGEVVRIGSECKVRCDGEGSGARWGSGLRIAGLRRRCERRRVGAGWAGSPVLFRSGAQGLRRHVPHFGVEGLVHGGRRCP